MWGKIRIGLGVFVFGCSYFVSADTGNGAVVEDLEELRTLFYEHQDYWVPISLPGSMILFQDFGLTVPFNVSGFPRKFTKRLNGKISEFGVVTYETTLVEDPYTRQVVIYDTAGFSELWRMDVDPLRDPYAYLRWSYGLSAVDSFEGISIDEVLRLDSAKVAANFLLVEDIFYVDYVNAEYEAQLAVSAEPTAVSMSVPMPGGTNVSTNVTGTASTVTNSGDVVFTFSLPEGFWNHAEIFKTTNLKYVPWSVAENRMAVAGQSQIEWTDVGSSNQPAGFYILSDADLSDSTDSDGDGYTDLRERFISKTDPQSFDEIDVDSDGMLDFYEITLFGSTAPQPYGDFDGDGLVNTQEMLLIPGYPGFYDPEVRFRSDPSEPDTDFDGMTDFQETVTYPFLDPNDPSDWDYDRDGISNSVEIAIGTSLDKWDSDGDTLPDGIEYEWDASDPWVWDDVNYDGDNDGLSLYEEYQHNTDPGTADSDGDNTNDGDEVGQGGNPADPDDGGSAPEASDIVELKLTIGDHSTSESEIYEMTVDGERTIRLHSGTPGNVEIGTFTFRKGESYTVTLKHVGSDREAPDYDYTAKVEVADSAAAQSQSAPLAEGVENLLMLESTSTSSGTIIIDDTEGILGVHGTTGGPFLAEAKSAKVHVMNILVESIDATSDIEPTKINYQIYPPNVSIPSITFTAPGMTETRANQSGLVTFTYNQTDLVQGDNSFELEYLAEKTEFTATKEQVITSQALETVVATYPANQIPPVIIPLSIQHKLRAIYWRIVYENVDVLSGSYTLQLEKSTAMIEVFEDPNRTIAWHNEFHRYEDDEDVYDDGIMPELTGDQLPPITLHRKYNESTSSRFLQPGIGLTSIATLDNITFSEGGMQVQPYTLTNESVDQSLE